MRHLSIGWFVGLVLLSGTAAIAEQYDPATLPTTKVARPDGTVVDPTGGGGGGSAGSVGAAGVNGTTAQSVQGITGGVPQNAFTGQYSTTLPTLTTGSPAYLAIDVNGRLIQAPGAQITNAGTFAVQNTTATPTGANVVGSTTLRAAGTNRSATVTTTASTLMASNTSRQGWKIKNDCTVAVWINFDATATATAGSGNIQIPAGGYMSSEPGFIETGAMSAIATSGSCALTAREH